MGALTSLATTGLNLAVAQRREDATQKKLDGEQQQRSEQVLGRAQEDRRERDTALRRRLAEERARAGAGGVGGSGGSIDAVLSGLVAESSAQQTASDAETRSRLDALRGTYDARSRRSLLDYNSRWLDAGSRALAGLGGRRRSLLD